MRKPLPEAEACRVEYLCRPRTKHLSKKGTAGTLANAWVVMRAVSSGKDILGKIDQRLLISQMSTPNNDGGVDATADRKASSEAMRASRDRSRQTTRRRLQQVSTPPVQYARMIYPGRSRR